MMTYDDTKKWMEEALKTKAPAQFQTKLGSKLMAFVEGLHTNIALLEVLSPEQREKVLIFVPKLSFKSYPDLAKLLTPEQKTRMGIKASLYPMLSKVLAEVRISDEEFKKEHEHLLKLLDNPTPEALKKEHDKQKKEAEEKVGLKHTEAATWKWCGKCVRMTKHDNGECAEH